MSDRVFGILTLAICALNVGDIVFKLFQPDVQAKWFGCILISSYCLLAVLIINKAFKKGGE